MFLLKGNFTNRVRSLCYDPLVSDFIGNIEAGRLVYMGRQYDRINLRNDKRRVFNDLNTAILAAKERV